MQSKNIVKALEKSGARIIKIESSKGIHYYAENDKRKCDWFTNDYNEEPGSVYVVRKINDDEIRTDYFSGTFCETIKQTIYFMNQ